VVEFERLRLIRRKKRRKERKKNQLQQRRRKLLIRRIRVKQRTLKLKKKSRVMIWANLLIRKALIRPAQIISLNQRIFSHKKGGKGFLSSE